MHEFLPRDAHATHTHRAIYAATGCLSVRLSVTRADPGWEGRFVTETGRRKSLSGVQGRNPERSLGDFVPPRSYNDVL